MGWNVLVTGGGGFLGGAIVKRLVERGDRVRSLSRKPYPALESLGVEQIPGDISQGDVVEKACRGMDAVFHVAGKPGVWGDYEDYFRTNVTGTCNVIASCRKLDVAVLVHTSSPSVVFDGSDMEGVDESVPYPETWHAHYPRTKAIAEQEVVKACREQAICAIVLRPHLIWGPGDNHLVPRIISRARRLVRIGDGKNRVDTIYIDNAADAHILAADHLAENPSLSGRIYFISQGEPVYLWDMVNAILKAGGLPPVTKSVSRKTARRLGSAMEMLYKLFKLSGEPPMTRFVADELATSHWFDIDAARRDLGYRPSVSMEEGLCRLENWLKSNSGLRN
jgi:nucleoside-diphosphate-sugar epimerase